MIYKHKNPTILTRVLVHKIQYRDAKRIKMKISLVDTNGNLLGQPFNCCVKPDWFKNFTTFYNTIQVVENTELLELDNEKENWSV